MSTFSEWLKEKRGNLTDLAVAIGVTPGAIPQWKGVVPSDRVYAVSAYTGISISDLRPDWEADAERIRAERGETAA